MVPIYNSNYTVVVVSHIQHIGCPPEKAKRESLAAHPPPPPHAARSKEIQSKLRDASTCLGATQLAVHPRERIFSRRPHTKREKSFIISSPHSLNDSLSQCSHTVKGLYIMHPYKRVSIASAFTIFWSSWGRALLSAGRTAHVGAAGWAYSIRGPAWRFPRTSTGVWSRPHLGSRWRITPARIFARPLRLTPLSTIYAVVEACTWSLSSSPTRLQRRGLANLDDDFHLILKSPCGDHETIPTSSAYSIRHIARLTNVVAIAILEEVGIKRSPGIHMVRKLLFIKQRFIIHFRTRLRINRNDCCQSLARWVFPVSRLSTSAPDGCVGRTVRGRYSGSCTTPCVAYAPIHLDGQVGIVVGVPPERSNLYK